MGAPEAMRPTHFAQNAARVLDFERHSQRASERVFKPNEAIGGYVVVRLIAMGGFGDVYEAAHRVSGRRVALKIIQARATNEAELEQGLREAEILRELRSPHVVKIYEFGVVDGRIWMTMELLEGRTLREVLQAGQPLPVPLVMEYAAGIAAGLSVAHDRRIVHRDLKPENIFITSDGHVVLLDMGAAKWIGEAHRKKDSQRLVGTVAYMAPEYLLSAVDGLPLDWRADLYALGLIGWEMLTGYYAYSIDRVSRQFPDRAALIEKQLRELPPRLKLVAPWVPEHVAEVFERMLHKERELRHPSIHEAEWEIRRAQRRFVEQRLEREQHARSAKVSPVPPDTLSPNKRLTRRAAPLHGSSSRQTLNRAAIGSLWRRYAPGLGIGVVVGLLMMVVVRVGEAQLRERRVASSPQLAPISVAKGEPALAAATQPAPAQTNQAAPVFLQSPSPSPTVKPKILPTSNTKAAPPRAVLPPPQRPQPPASASAPPAPASPQPTPRLSIY